MEGSLEEELVDVLSATYPLAGLIARTLPDHGVRSPDRDRLVKAIDKARLDAAAVAWLGRLISERCITLWGLGGLCHGFRDVIEQPWAGSAETIARVVRDRLPPRHPGKSFELMLRDLNGR